MTPVASVVLEALGRIHAADLVDSGWIARPEVRLRYSRREPAGVRLRVPGHLPRADETSSTSVPSGRGSRPWPAESRAEPCGDALPARSNRRLELLEVSRRHRSRTRRSCPTRTWVVRRNLESVSTQRMKRSEPLHRNCVSSSISTRSMPRAGRGVTDQSRCCRPRRAHDLEVVDEEHRRLRGEQQLVDLWRSRTLGSGVNAVALTRGSGGLRRELSASIWPASASAKLLK